MVLIKSVAQSIPSYVMSCFLMPATVIRRLNSMMANFWWGQKAEERKIHWCTWDSTCSAKKEGGLGFRDLECFNKAFLAKQGWRLLTYPDSLLAQSLKAKYYPRSSFLEAKLGHAPSYSWRSIIAGREILERNVCWNIRDGRSARIWKDPWIPNCPPLMPPPQTIFLQDIHLVRDLLNSAGDEWNSPLIHQIFPQNIAQSILSIPLCSSQQEDCIRWNHTKDGNYSVKSGYRVAKNMKDVFTSKPSSSHNNDDLWRWFWSLNIPPKIKIFLWRCMRGISQTKAKLNERGIISDPWCSRCGAASETPEHALRDCHWSSFFWRACPLRLTISSNDTRLKIQDWILSCILHKSPEYVEMFAAFLWVSWKARNSFEFKKKELSHEECFFMASNIILDYQSSNKKHFSAAAPHYSGSRWNPPPLGSVKCNTDASLGLDGNTGLGGVIRDSNCVILKLISEFIPSRVDIELAEALACRNGLLVARDLGYKTVLFEMDNQAIVDQIGKGSIPRSEAGKIIADILHIAKSFDRASFQWIRRSSNRLAHEMANLSRNPYFVLDESFPLPATLQRLVTAEAALSS